MTKRTHSVTDPTTNVSAPIAYHVDRSSDTGLITVSPSAQAEGPCFVLTASQALCLGAALVDKAANTTAYAVEDAFKLLDMPGVSDHDRARKAWAFLERVV